MLTFTTEWRARPLKRHRHTRTGHVYDPSAGEKREWMVLARRHAPRQPLRGPLVADLEFCYQRPNKPAHAYPRSAGDVDNLTKFFLDAMNGVFYVDDSQITELRCRKLYGPRSYTRISLRLQHGSEQRTHRDMERQRKRPRRPSPDDRGAA